MRPLDRAHPIELGNLKKKAAEPTTFSLSVAELFFKSISRHDSVVNATGRALA
jgi:hypothetical protein